MDFVVIDFETANEKRNSACAIGITKVRNGLVCDTYYRLFRPFELRFSSWNTKIHGIKCSDVDNCPSLGECWSEIAGYLENELVVAHNSSFDISVLRHSLHAAQIQVPRLSYLCSLQLSKMLWPQLASHSLSFLANTFKIQLLHHHAGSDSQAAAELVLLGAKESGLLCLRELATRFQLRIGEVFSEDEWIPSAAPGIRQNIAALELTIPEGYDITAHPFYQKNVVFTGKLLNFTRTESQQIVELFGGQATESVSKNTDYLVTGIQDIRTLAEGTSESSKLRKAKKLRCDGCQLEIMTENDFSELIFNPMNHGNTKC